MGLVFEVGGLALMVETQDRDWGTLILDQGYPASAP